MSQAIKKLGKRRLIALAAAVLVFSSATIMVVTAATSSYPLEIQEGKSTVSIEAKGNDPLKILSQADIVLEEGDWLDTAAFREGEGGKLTLYRACAITVTDGDAPPLTTRQSGTVARALEQLGIHLSSEDDVSPAPDTPLKNGMAIQISRTFNVTIEADGLRKGLRMTGGTVSQALEIAGVFLGEDDECKPALSEELDGVVTIQVGRVSYLFRTETEAAPFETLRKKTGDLPAGTEKVSVKGKDGEKEVVYKDKYVDGKFTGSTVDSETITQQPVTRVLLAGTKPISLKRGAKAISELAVPASLQLDENGLPQNYSKIIDGTAKAYSGDKNTSTGRKPMPGHIAVDPKQIPYGTELYIVSADGKYVYGYAIAADTGGFVKTKSCTVDLYMNSVSQCYEWGHRAVRIYVL